MAEIGVVLMPTDIAVLTGILHPGGILVEQNVRADQILDNVENRRVCGEPVQKRLTQINLGSRSAFQHPAHGAFDMFEFAPEFGGLLAGKNADRRNEAVTMIGRDLIRAEALRHVTAWLPPLAEKASARAVQSRRT